LAKLTLKGIIFKMKASVRVMKAAGFLALDWKHLSVAQTEIKIIECYRA